MKTNSSIKTLLVSGVLAGLALTGPVTHAANFVWINPASGGWNTSTNWSPNGVPGANDTVIIINAGVTVSLNSATSVGGIILGTNAVGANLSLSNQTLVLYGPLTIGVNSFFTVSGSGVLSGNTNALVRGTVSWQGGLLAGVLTLATNGTLTISNSSTLHDMPGCVLTNNGTVNWVSGEIRGGTGTVIYNNGLWDAQSDQTMSGAYGGVMTFNNIGVLRKSGGNGNTLINGGAFYNQISGVMNVQRGNLRLSSSGNFAGGAISNNLGTTYFDAGNFNIVGTTTSGNVVESSGNLVGNNVINGTFTWAGGKWNGASVTTTTNSVVTITGGLNDLNAAAVTNNGTVNWGDSTIRGGTGTVIYNNGLWNSQFDQAITAAYGGAMTFNNSGTFRKEITSGSTIIGSPITFNNTGKLDAQNGNIALQGGYTLANGTSMGFGLGGTAGNGSVTLSGAAAFAGSYSVNLTGFFWPAAGSTFNLLNYTSETGVLFTNSTILPAVGYLTWQTNYNATAFVLTMLARTATTNPVSTNVVLSSLNPSNVLIQWPGDHTGWRLQSQTNTLVVGLRTNWAAVAGSSTTNQLLLPIVKTNNAVFYRMIYP